MALSVLIAMALLLPLGLLVVDARDAGWSEVSSVLFRQRSLSLLEHTVALAALVVVLAGTIGVATAWCTERMRLPGRRLWTVLLVLPVALPDFVVGWAWHSIVPTVNPLLGATVVMTLGTYPLVYLPVAAALRRTDRAMEDASLSLGLSELRTFFRVTLPLIRTAVLGGCVLVVLTVISEYGVFEVLRYQTFTTEIFTQFQFNAQAAGALSVPLVCLGLLALAVDGIVPRRPVVATHAPRRPGAGATPRRASPGVVGALVALVALGVGVPISTLAYWMARSQHTTLPAAATLASATWATVAYSAWGAVVAVVLALPVAFMSARRSSGPRTVLERSTYVTQAMPGVVVALSFVFFATRFVYALYQTSILLIAAYAVLHFPLALVCVKTSVSQAPARLTDVGQSLGRRPLWVFVRVTVPLIVPGLLAGFCLVFLTAVTELTATLVLVPIGVQTLATQFWAYQSEVAYGAAAPYALVIIGLAMVPGALLGLWFDRERYARPAGTA
ncbi:MAG TPA: iron ABC transporter permease [Acidimicrobiales bacterium]|nr:iron ABC transporter permease [Acidimicrobiales bacterium]HUI03829.1 iron ABC transporter permease [Acidimicrobiales bacterium]